MDRSYCTFKIELILHQTFINTHTNISQISCIAVFILYINLKPLTFDEDLRRRIKLGFDNFINYFSN